MKRIIFLASLLSFIALQNVFCQEMSETENIENGLTSATTENSENTALESENSLESDSEPEKEAPVKKSRKTKTDEYLNIDYEKVRNFNYKGENIRIYLNGKTGSYNIFSKDMNKSETAVLSKIEAYSSSRTLLNINGRAYALNKDAGVKKTVRKLYDGGFQLAYEAEDLANVVIDFSVFTFGTEYRQDFIKLVYYVTNTTDKSSRMALKAVFDTVLGEGNPFHFTTGFGLPVSSSRKFYYPEKEKYVTSTNGKTSVQFIFTGETVTAPACVTIANIDSIYQGAWIPEISDGDSFSKVLSYNNSALCLNWPEKVILPGKTESVTLYIAIGEDGVKPQGEEYIAYLNKLYGKEKTPDAKTEEPVTPEAVPVTGPATEQSVPSEVPSEKEEFDASSVVQPDVDFIPVENNEMNLDLEYVQSLINRINMLQSDAEYVDREEIRRLNAELDSILEIIRQRE